MKQIFDHEIGLGDMGISYTGLGKLGLHQNPTRHRTCKYPHDHEIHTQGLLDAFQDCEHCNWWIAEDETLHYIQLKFLHALASFYYPKN